MLLAFGDGPGFRGCGEFDPFTVSDIDARGRLRVGIKALGACSARVQALQPGTTVRLQDPFGIFLQDEADRPDAHRGPWLWVAGGIGITPFIELIEPWCGREASEAYRTKTRGRPHSRRATAMMADYRIGTLAPSSAAR